MTFADDAGLFAALRPQLFTAVVGNVLDILGPLHQFLPPHIRPLRYDIVVLGRAMPVLEADFNSAGGHAGSAPPPSG